MIRMEEVFMFEGDDIIVLETPTIRNLHRLELLFDGVKNGCV
jgi:hypothetical protein